MLREKKKILICRIFWLSIFVLGIIITLIVRYAPRNIKIVKDEGYTSSYYESLDETTFKIKITFNKDVDSGYATVAFYDASGNLLEQIEDYFYGYDNVLSSTFFVDGKVDSYEILSHKISASVNYTLVWTFALTTLFLFMGLAYSMAMSCKKYEYNDSEILVYAGFCSNYMKVNGTIVDEHNTITNWTPIYLSCTLDDGTKLDATISTSHTIALKINDKLYTPAK